MQQMRRAFFVFYYHAHVGYVEAVGLGDQCYDCLLYTSDAADEQ